MMKAGSVQEIIEQQGREALGECVHLDSLRVHQDLMCISVAGSPLVLPRISRA
jgi:hypothetical protein